VELLAEYEVPVEGKRAVIIGRGLTIGRPWPVDGGCVAALQRRLTVVHTASRTWRR